MLWIHFTTSRWTTVARISSSAISYESFSEADTAAGMMEECTAGVMVLDGFIKRHYEPVGGLVEIYARAQKWMSDDPQRRLIIVGSQQVAIKLQEAIPGMRSFELGSWTRSDYDGACAHAAFFESVKGHLAEEAEEAKGAAGGAEAVEGGEWGEGDEGDEETELQQQRKEDLIKAKFFYAGGSARWMFGAKWQEAIADIDTHISRVRSRSFCCRSRPVTRATIA